MIYDEFIKQSWKNFMAHQKTENFEKFGRKLSRITNHLILITPFPEIPLCKMDPLLRGGWQGKANSTATFSVIPAQTEIHKKDN